MVFRCDYVWRNMSNFGHYITDCRSAFLNGGGGLGGGDCSICDSNDWLLLLSICSVCGWLALASPPSTSGRSFSHKIASFSSVVGDEGIPFALWLISSAAMGTSHKNGFCFCFVFVLCNLFCFCSLQLLFVCNLKILTNQKLHSSWSTQIFGGQSPLVDVMHSRQFLAASKQPIPGQVPIFFSELANGMSDLQYYCWGRGRTSWGSQCASIGTILKDTWTEINMTINNSPRIILREILWTPNVKMWVSKWLTLKCVVIYLIP